MNISNEEQSIDLTRLPSSASPSPTGQPIPDRIEYSSREIPPPQLIVQQLLRAHSVFLLHHAPTLQDLYNRSPRATLCKILEQFWTRFIWNWNVLLSGNPVVDIFNGTKLAAGGELGIGVGEEEWGSGEREVLEDFISRTDGLDDLVVSRFGEPPVQPTSSKGADKSESSAKEDQLWIGSDSCPRPSDGVIFSGVGAISRQSLAQVSLWMEWIYRYGEDAYGVRDDPWSIRRRKRRKEKSSRASRDTTQVPKRDAKEQSSSTVGHTPPGSPPPGIPPPLVTAEIPPQPQPPPSNSESRESSSTREPPVAVDENLADTSAFGTENFMKYLTLGYGSSWGNPAKVTLTHPRVSVLRETSKNSKDDSGDSDTKSAITESGPESGAGAQDHFPRKDEAIGRFIIGLRDDPEGEDTDDEDMEDEENERKLSSTSKSHRKILTRTLDMKSGQPNLEDDEQGTMQYSRSFLLSIILTILFS